MSVIEYIILSFALAIPMEMTMRGCALKNPIRLTRGLAVSALLALEHTVLVLVGILIGNLLRFDLPEYDNLVYLGLLTVVALRMLFPAFHKKDVPSYEVAKWGTVLLLGIATGVNTLFVGMGLGFRVDVDTDLWKVGVPLYVAMLLLSYWGIMLGRRKKEVSSHRWQLVAVLFLLAFAIKGAFFGE